MSTDNQQTPAMRKAADPLPCPFCGNGEVRVYVIGDNYFRAQCFKCEAATGRQRTEAEAIEAWNARDPNPEPSELAALNETIAARDAEVERLTAKLKRIEDAVSADAYDLEKMRDGTKLTRAGLVQIIAHQKEELGDVQREAAELRGETADANLKRLAITAERDGLRAEVARLKDCECDAEDVCEKHVCNSLLRAELESVKAELSQLRSQLAKAEPATTRVAILSRMRSKADEYERLSVEARSYNDEVASRWNARREALSNLADEIERTNLGVAPPARPVLSEGDREQIEMSRIAGLHNSKEFLHCRISWLLSILDKLTHTEAGR